MFSYHEDKRHIGLAGRYDQDFKCVDHDEVAVLLKLILEYTHSPITWYGGKRGSEHFKASNWVALEFDEGAISSEDAQDIVEGMHHVIVAISPIQSSPCGMYSKETLRVYLRLSSPVWSAREYSFLATHWSNIFGANPLWSGAAQIFYPAHAFISYGVGDSLPPVQYPQLPGKNGFLKELETLLYSTPMSDTSLDYACYLIACLKKREGWNFDQVLTLLSENGLVDESSQDVARSAVGDAFK